MSSIKRIQENVVQPQRRTGKDYIEVNFHGKKFKEIANKEDRGDDGMV